uniref:Uncharacterized protein n=1 Tax=Timema bartmani TaxID=61472 RepID=A0A7R9F4Y0_9NEOP|nr:unnamed protein product [Timema bartmani]
MLAQTVSVRKSSRNWEHAQRAPSLMCMVSVWPSVERYTPSPDTVLIFMCGSACGDEGQGRDVTGAGRGAAVFNVLINSRTDELSKELYPCSSSDRKKYNHVDMIES